MDPNQVAETIETNRLTSMSAAVTRHLARVFEDAGRKAREDFVRARLLETFVERMAAARERSERTLAYIRQQYGVPAFRRHRVWFKGKRARITGGCTDGGAYIKLRFDDGSGKKWDLYHPTWEMRYAERDGFRK